MLVYLAGSIGREYLYDKFMKIYLEGEHTVKNGRDANWTGLKILESYEYVKNNTFFPNLVKMNVDLLLDSGAFTYMSGNGGGVNWDTYIEQYAEFINKYDIKLFFELDIDSVIGIGGVERLRNKLELLTGKKSIPVWHKSRGLNYWKQMCENYDYVAVGGIVTKEIKRTEYAIFNNLLSFAYSKGCKVHGLGFTNLKGLELYKFYSVDSTSWIFGNRGGYIYLFNGKTIQQIKKPNNTKLKSKDVALHNFNEWVKFGNYAEKYL